MSHPRPAKPAGAHRPRAQLVQGRRRPAADGSPARARSPRPRSPPRPGAGCTGRGRSGRARPRGRARSPAGRRPPAPPPAPRRWCRPRPASTSHLEPVERVVGRVGHDAWRARPGSARQALQPQLEMVALAGAHGGVVALRPGLERRHRAGDALLADLHAAADAAVLQEGRADQVLAPGDDAGGGAAQELVGAVDDEVGAGGEEALADRIRTRRRRSPARRARGRSAQNSAKRDLAELHGMVGDHIDARRPCARLMAPSR